MLTVPYESVGPLKTVSANSKPHVTDHFWHMMLRICGLSIGGVLLFIETVSGITIPSVLAIVGLLNLVAIGNYLVRKNRPEQAQAFTVLLPARNRIYSPSSQSPSLRKTNQLCFTNEERKSWLKNEPNFSKRIATPLGPQATKRKRYGDILQFLRKLECLILSQ